MAESLILLDQCLAKLDLKVGTSEQKKLLWLGEELLRWNRKINLTSFKTLDEVIYKHLVDSLTVLPLLHPQERLLDVGSGGGFPGLPLSIVDPGRQVVTVDAVGKKIHFQRHIVRYLDLHRCHPLHSRIEDLPGWKDFGAGFDVVVSRAFSSLGSLCVLARPCLKAGGRLIAMKGPEGEDELLHEAPLLEALGFQIEGKKMFDLPLDAGKRMLITLYATARRERLEGIKTS